MKNNPNLQKTLVFTVSLVYKFNIFRKDSMSRNSSTIGKRIRAVLSKSPRLRSCGRFIRIPPCVHLNLLESIPSPLHRIRPSIASVLKRWADRQENWQMPISSVNQKLSGIFISNFFSETEINVVSRLINWNSKLNMSINKNYPFLTLSLWNRMRFATPLPGRLP